jgi:hypothetical protein
VADAAHRAGRVAAPTLGRGHRAALERLDAALQDQLHRHPAAVLLLVLEQFLDVGLLKGCDPRRQVTDEHVVVIGQWQFVVFA